MLDISNLSIILEAMHEGVMIVDNHYTIQYYNSAMGKIDGYTPDEVIGKKLLDIFPYQTYEKNTIMQALKERKKIVNQLQTYITSKGRQNSTVSTTIPVFKDGEVVAVVEACKDISSEQKLMEDILKMQSKLNKTDNGDSGNEFCRYHFTDILGQSDVLLDTIKRAQSAAQTDSFVFINGETGTGKELFAQSIHNSSARRNKPFIAVNCAALPGELLEGILFGTVRGGFTGSTDRIGLFEEANHGTLLLDEIDSMDMKLQGKLLRVLQEGVVRRVGGTKDIKLDVRVISTTNSYMLEAIRDKRFRPDLFYRLSVVNIVIPPLRERGQDIMYLTAFFIKEFNAAFGKQVMNVSDEVKRFFKKYYWPGNVREMQHCIEGVMNVIGDEREINMEHLPASLIHFYQTKEEGQRSTVYMSDQPFKSMDRPKRYTGSDLRAVTDSFEKDGIINALEKCRGNVSEAARLIGMKRQTLQYTMKKYGISKDNLIVHWNTDRNE